MQTVKMVVTGPFNAGKTEFIQSVSEIDVVSTERKMLGFVVMVDSTRPETFREARSILETFRAYAPTPYVVAANKQDREDAWDLEDMRIALRLDAKVKLLPCIAFEKESVKSILLELLYSILSEMDAGKE
jgi:signal recognition particle receptor subunit beta